MTTLRSLISPFATLMAFSALCLTSMLTASDGKPQSEAQIVAAGTARAEIVVAPERPRMVTLAALELQHYLKKISGAELPIVTEPKEGSVRIYVGKSSFTEQLDLDDQDLKYGGYRMVSGDNYLVLLGHDSDFTPPVPSPKSRSDIPRAEAEWDAMIAKVNDVSWGFPFKSMFKEKYAGKVMANDMFQRYGADNEKLWPSGDFSSGFWSEDEGGSLNAVFGYLHSLGVRLYMPGEVGEVIPEIKSIPLPAVKETVKPAYALRAWNWYNMAVAPFESVLWYRQIGNNSGGEVLGPNLNYAHGLTKVHQRDDFKAKYPKAFALIGKTRDTEQRGYGTACFSSQELVDQAVKYARFMYDTYNVPQVSLWPTDGFKPCQCELCAGKEPSELVWTFVNRVATELYKTHPDRMVTCGAYTSYKLAPVSIQKFSPNVAVFISNWSRPMFMNPPSWNAYWASVKEWQKRLAPEHILRVENNRLSMADEENDFQDPFLVPQGRAMARDMKALNGISLGEISEQSQKKGKMVNPAINAFPLYVLARWSWDPNQDYDATLDEYLTEFFGPASGEMRKVYAFAEEAYLRAATAAVGKTAKNPGNVGLPERIKLIEMLEVARAKAGETVYGERITLHLNELPSLADLKVALDQAKKTGDPRDIARQVQLPPTGDSEVLAFKDNLTKAAASLGTTLQVRQEGIDLIFTIRCEEPDMKNVVSLSNVTSGDSVAILLEPPGHSYYQIEVNPEGVIFDNDLGSPVGEKWQSQAEVSTKRGVNFWLVEVKIPVVDPETGAADPNHNVVGLMPSAERPWFFNVGRSRPRGETTEGFMVSPTGTKGYHVPKKFIKLVGSETKKIP